MATAEHRFEADKKFAYRALQDARQYVTDFDRTGSKAEALYERLARADRLMRPWSTDGTSVQAKKAIEYLQEITSIISEKIGPASRREFSEQGGTRHHATKKTPAQLQREIDEVLAKPVTGSHAQQPLFGLRIVPSERAGYSPGKHVLQYKDRNGMWFDIGDPKSKESVEAALRMESRRLVPGVRVQRGNDNGQRS